MTPAQSGRMSDHLVRIGNLRAIQKANGWTDSELGRQCGRQPQQVASWFSGDRQIGERLARSLEERLKLQRYALDDRANVAGAQEKSPGQGVVVAPTSSGRTSLKEAPIIRWGDIGNMLNAENASLKKKSPHLDTFAPSSAFAKFIEMPDDSMSPDFLARDHVLFDPAEVPRAGDVVLVRLPSHEHFVRVFRPRTAYIFDAVALNSNYQPLSSTDDGAVVVAVMVEHRRYRRAY